MSAAEEAVVFPNADEKMFNADVEVKIDGFGIRMNLFSTGRGLTPQSAIAKAVETFNQQLGDLGLMLYMRRL